MEMMNSYCTLTLIGLLCYMYRNRNLIRAIILLLLSALIMNSCSRVKEQEVFVFDPSKNYPEFPLSLNDVADVSYIKIGGEEDGIYLSTLRSSGVFIDHLHRRLFACHPSIGVLEFDSTGRFLRRIGRLGRGPGEYMNVYFYVQPEKERVGVYDPIREKFLVYKYDGAFLEDEGITARILPGFLTFLIKNDCLIDFNPNSVVYNERDGRTFFTSEKTLRLFPLNGQSTVSIKDIQYERPRVMPQDWGEDNYKLMMPGHLIPSYSGLMMSTHRSDTTYVIEDDFSWRPFLVNERHNGVQEGCLYPVSETKDYLFLCHQNNLQGGRMYYFAIDKKTRQEYKITKDESNPLPGPLQGKVQIEDAGLTKNPEYRFWEFQPQRLKEDCYEYLPEELKTIVDQCDEDSNPILMIIKFKE